MRLRRQICEKEKLEYLEDADYSSESLKIIMGWWKGRIENSILFLDISERRE